MKNTPTISYMFARVLEENRLSFLSRMKYFDQRRGGKVLKAAFEIIMQFLLPEWNSRQSGS